MKHYYCNPLNVDYLYQFNQQGMGQQMGPVQISREAADPSMIYFKGKYYIFASMTLGVWVSEDLAHWENKRLPDNLPFYDYAPDVRVIGDYVYFCASKREEVPTRRSREALISGIPISLWTMMDGCIFTGDAPI